MEIADNYNLKRLLEFLIFMREIDEILEEIIAVAKVIDEKINWLKDEYNINVDILKTESWLKTYRKEMNMNIKKNKNDILKQQETINKKTKAKDFLSNYIETEIFLYKKIEDKIIFFNKKFKKNPLLKLRKEIINDEANKRLCYRFCSYIN
jgi:hypothetical protein